MNTIAVIGGSGIKDTPLFDKAEWRYCDVGRGLDAQGINYQINRERDVIFIPRHGNGDEASGPAHTSYQANIVAAHMLGADVIIATSAVGSFKKSIPVGSVIVPSDYVDETGRDDTLFEGGLIVHTNPRPAFSPSLTDLLWSTIQDKSGHFGFERGKKYAMGTYVCIPGDRFGTSAEGAKRSQYADIVGMTLCPEASLALQAGIHYAALAFVVDRDADANHEGGTLKIMEELSAPNRVPSLIEKVTSRAIHLDLPPLETQLSGNIIPIDVDSIVNPHLRKIAEELIETYTS